MRDPDAKAMLDLAAKVAFRATGYVEPNPLVGCVIVRPGEGPASERIIGIGHHWVYGGPHAEVEALKRCRALGHDTAGSTAYVTLEPCNGHGKNPPCVKALVEAGVVRVVCAARDESEVKGCGGAALNAIGIPCEFTRVSQRAVDVSEPWRHRMKTPLPWVIAKWAQTVDGRLATRGGEGKGEGKAEGEGRWISNGRSRMRVHRIRGIADAVIVGAGTVRADDPLLTVRGVPDRREPARVVVSRSGALALDRQVVMTARQTPTILVCDAVPPGHASELERAGVQILRVSDSDEHGWLGRCLVRLRRERAVFTAMVEGGGTLLRAMLDESLINEAHIHVGSPSLAKTLTVGQPVATPGPVIADASKWRLVSSVRVESDTQSVYRRRD